MSLEVWSISTQMCVFFFSPLVNKPEKSDRIQLAYKARRPFLQKCSSLVGRENLKEISLCIEWSKVFVKLPLPPKVGMVDECSDRFSRLGARLLLLPVFVTSRLHGCEPGEPL